jgi:hypothetical protein
MACGKALVNAIRRCDLHKTVKFRGKLWKDVRPFSVLPISCPTAIIPRYSSRCHSLLFGTVDSPQAHPPPFHKRNLNPPGFGPWGFDSPPDTIHSLSLRSTPPINFSLLPAAGPGLAFLCTNSRPILLDKSEQNTI